MKQSDSANSPTLLPMPIHGVDRAVLIMMRRMGGYGLRDAHAAMLALKNFGTGFRQPLVLLRCYMAEIAQVSERSIMIANCCAPKMTRDEGLLLETLAQAGQQPGGNPDRAQRNLQELTGGRNAGRALTVASAFSNALHTSGIQLEG